MQTTELLSAFEEERTTKARVKVLEKLASLGRDAMPALSRMVSALDDPEPAVREWAAQVLARLGPVAKVAGPKLLRNVRDDAPRVRASSVWALGEIGYGQGAETLTQALEDPHPEVRRWATAALRLLGVHEATYRIIALFKDPVASVRRSATLAVASLATDGEHEKKRRAQIELARGKRGGVDPKVRADALEALLLAIIDPDRGVVIEAYGCLGWFKAAELEATIRRTEIKGPQRAELEERLEAVLTRALAKR